jgi:hypothetical protein
MLLLAMVPFLTMAQKRSKKNKEIKTEAVKPIPNTNSKASSFTFNSDTKTPTLIVIDSFNCDKENFFFCEALTKSARKKLITFKTKDVSSDARLKSDDSKFRYFVNGTLLIGKKKYEADLFYDVSKYKEGFNFVGNIIIDGSSLGLDDDKVMITVKYYQK